MEYHPPLQSWEPNWPPWLNRPPPPPPTQTWEPIDDRLRPGPEAPLTKRQLKHRRNRDSELAKKFVSLNADINNLKSQMEALKDKITKASKSTHSGFKRKKIRSMKREADKIALGAVESRVPKIPISGVPLKLHPPNRNKCIEAKIAEINKKIRRAKNRRNKEHLIAKREALRVELNWGPRQLEGAFGGAYRHYRIDGMPGIDPDMFFTRTRRFLINLLVKEARMEAVRSQATTWIKFRKDGEMVELAFNSRMLNVYNLSDMNKIVDSMISHMVQQIENLVLKDSKLVFNEVMHMGVDFHRFNLTRGSSYLPLPDWLACKKALINPKNSDLECFKWAVITAMRWEEIGKNPKQITKLKRFENDFDWTGVGFPASFGTIKRFESQNQISINVLAVEDKRIHICRKGVDHYDCIENLMLITENNCKHYLAIKSLRRLLSKQNSKHKEAQHFCTNCLQGFREEPSRNEHMGYCKNNETV